MKRFRLTYNGITSEFNGEVYGTSYTKRGSIILSRSYEYHVRPSKTNTMDIKILWECFKEDGTKEWHFKTRGTKRIPRGLKVIVEII